MQKNLPLIAFDVFGVLVVTMSVLRWKRIVTGPISDWIYLSFFACAIIGMFLKIRQSKKKSQDGK